jgi:hypothetical protein
MRIITFGLDAPTIERILTPIGEPSQPPTVLPVRSPPQGAFGFDQTPATTDGPEMDQTAGRCGVRRRSGGWRTPIGGLIDALGRGVSQ